MHWGADFPTNQWPRTHYELNDEAGFDAEFHVYGVEWTTGMLHRCFVWNCCVSVHVFIRH